MSGDFPEEWFRPTRNPADPPPEADEERWTDQFKPGYINTGRPVAPPPEHRPRNVDGTGEPTAPSHRVGVPVVTIPPSSSGPEELDPAGRNPRWRPLIALFVIGLLLGIVLWFVRQQFWHQATEADAGLSTAPISPASPAGSTSASASAAPAPTPWLGAVTEVRPTSVAASCTAGTKEGYNGEKIGSQASRLVDGDATTGWRCDGDAVSQSLTFDFPKGTEIVGVRTVNGYTKITNGIDLYPQFRRALALQWSFPQRGGSFFVQQLSDGTTGAQEVRIPPTDAAGGIRAVIQQTSAPGTNEPSRDALVMTEISFLVRA